MKNNAKRKKKGRRERLESERDWEGRIFEQNHQNKNDYETIFIIILPQ